MRARRRCSSEATLQGIESGNIDLSLGVKAPGPEGGDLDVSLSGPFQGEGEGNLPQLDMTANAKGSCNGKDVDFEGGLVLLPNTAYVNYEGTEYEVDPTTFGFVESTLNRAQRESGAESGAAGAAACQEEAGKLKVADFLENGANEGSADVGGTTTTQISGDLDVSGALDAVLEVAESQACRVQLAAAGPLPSKAEVEKAKSEENGSAVKSAHVDLYVGDDDIVRQISAQLQIEPKNGGSGPKSVELDLDLKLTGVNEEQTISAPEGAEPLSKLFRKLGVNPIELLGLLQGEGGRRRARRTARRAGRNPSFARPRLPAGALRLALPADAADPGRRRAGPRRQPGDAGLRRLGPRHRAHGRADGACHRGAGGALGAGHRRPAQRHLRQRAGADHRPLRAAARACTRWSRPRSSARSSATSCSCWARRCWSAGWAREKQVFSRTGASVQTSMLLLAAAALLMPAIFELVEGKGPAEAGARLVDYGSTVEHLSFAVAIVLIATYVLGLSSR